MPLELTAVVGVSLAALVVLLALSARSTGRWRGFVLELAAIVAFVVFLNRLFDFPFSPPVAAKGPSDDFVLAGALFICMLFGMASQFLYRRFEQPQGGRPPWDWGMFIAPVLASPIVFIPLLAAFQNANIDLKDLTAPRLMIFFVAYQNGFFWKEFFDRKQSEEAGQKP
jgi:cytochrome bd-type quinol oxidase subunit 2